MPNGVVKNKHDEKIWFEAKQLAKKEHKHDDFAYIMNIYEKMIGSSTTGDTNRELTSFNHLKIKDCIITAESVDEYLGSELNNTEHLGLDPKKVYRAYRPLNEIKKSIESYNDIPLTDEHYFVDQLATNKDKWLGGIGSNAVIKDGKVYNNVTIWDKNEVNKHLGVDDKLNPNEWDKQVKECLSAGYSFELVKEAGIWNNKPYDLKITNITCNHVALVKRGRVELAKLADSIINLEGNKMDKNELILDLLRKSNPQLIADAEMEVEKEEKEVKDRKRTKDKEVEKTGGESSTDSEEEEKKKKEEEEEEKKAKDKRAKDKRAKDKDKDDDDETEAEDEEEEEKKKEKAMTGDEISALIEKKVRQQLKDHHIARVLCEKVLGKTSFTADSTPEEMFNSTLNARKVDHKGYTLDTKHAMVKLLADTYPSESVKSNQRYTRTADSVGADDFKIISI